MYKVLSWKILTVMSQICKEVGRSVFSFITVIQIMPVLAAEWRITCKPA